MEGFGTDIVSGLSDILPEASVVGAGAVGIALALWGIPRLVRFAKKVAG